MKVGIKVFILCAVFGASWFTTEPAIARKRSAPTHSRAWWTNWWLDCQTKGSCEYNGQQYHFDAKAMKVRRGRGPASESPVVPESGTATSTTTASQSTSSTPTPPDTSESTETPIAQKPAEEKAPDLDAEREAANRNRARDPGDNASVPAEKSNCSREIAKSQAALAKYNRCLAKNNLPEIVWGVSGTGFLVDASRPGLQKKMIAIRNGKCLYEQTVSLGPGSERGLNGYRGGSERTPAGLFGLDFNGRKKYPGTKFPDMALRLHGGNAATRGILAHNGSTNSNSHGCIRLGGGMKTKNGNFDRMNKTFRSGVNNVFIYFENSNAPNGGCGTPSKIEPVDTSGDIMNSKLNGGDT